MAIQELEAELRAATGKNKVKKIKNAGFIPSVIYGGDTQPVSVSVELRALLKLYANNPNGKNAVISLRVKEGQKENAKTVITKAVSRDPVSNQIIHVDFYALDMNKKIIVEVPVKTLGIAKGQKLGGILLQDAKKIKIETLPNVIPDHLEVNVESLEIGQSIRAGDIKVPAGATVVSDPHSVVAHVEVPKAEKVAEATAATAEGASPADGAAAPAAAGASAAAGAKPATGAAKPAAKAGGK